MAQDDLQTTAMSSNILAGKRGLVMGVNRLGVATRLARARKDLSARLDASPSALARPDPRRPPYLRLVK